MAHFYEMIPEPIRALSHQAAIEAYVGRAGVLGEAIAGLNNEQLSARPVPGTWNIREIVVHLLDTDMAASYRMKRIIAEDQPTLDAYDENAFVAGLFYQQRDIALACECFRVNRLATADILRRLPEGAYERTAQHPEVGPLKLGQLLRLYVHHVDHHMAFLIRKREMVTR